MVVLRAIGGFFARIGRWIKETAWIQPLLIVGAIFAVIFAIHTSLMVLKAGSIQVMTLINISLRIN